MESDVIELPLSDRLWAWFETNKKPLFGITAVLAVAGVIIWFVVWHHDEKEVAAGEALSNVQESQLATGTARTDTTAAYLKIASEYPNSAAGARAVLMAAGNLFADGKYTDAQAQFERFTREYRTSPFMGEALLGVAACMDAQGKSDQAVNAYKDLIAHHPGDSFIPQAQFALARLYVAQNKPEQARDLLQQVERDPMLGAEAGMQLEELFAKYPKLAPAPATTTTVMPAKAPTAPAKVTTSAPAKAPTSAPAKAEKK